MSQVLGVSVTDLQIASVVMEVSTGNVLARNVVDLTDSSPDTVFDAITQLVESAPFAVDAVTVACAQRSMQVSLHNTVTAGAKTDPDWYSRTTITDTPFAFANVAAAQSDQRGVIVVLDLAADAVPFNELSIAAVDTESATVVGAVQLPTGGAREPVTDTPGAQAVAGAFGLLPSTDVGRSGVFVVGPGAEVPGVAPTLEYETQLPVQIASEPTYSAAHGAALHGRNRGVTGSNRTRWLALVGAAVAAAVLAAVVVGVVLFTGDDDEPSPAGSESSVTTSAPTTTTTAPTTTRSRPPSTTTTTTEEQTEEFVPPPAPPQETVTVTQPPRTVTRTTTPPAATTTTTTSSPASSPKPENPSVPAQGNAGGGAANPGGAGGG
ncbi:rod shape-determining protein [Williamsia phyllosphaerae]|uniref:DUF7159 domain-containing protein n=1 Tax=Williamsia phyllosphaerae TaxID=885042 RepID=A0ABQ1U7T9_9NOCA|nr:rod shape-determining protein [Williamsia phyllosphaerae]GGF12617.1 hypothetical protein GCM10007298_05670 [Williamsia phyllosphaerae]